MGTHPVSFRQCAKKYQSVFRQGKLDASALGETVNADQQGTCAGFNKIMAELPKTLPNSHVISSAGCTSNDRLHFNSAGSREFGKRYGEKMLSVLGYKVAEPK